MKPIILIRICLSMVFFCAGIFLVFFIHSKKRPPTDISTVVADPTPTPVRLMPPKQALQGTILQSTGKLVRIPWDSPDSFPASEGATLFQEDEVSTAENSDATISVPGTVTLHLEENTDVLLGVMIPQSIVFLQKSGTITYQLDKPVAPISIRSGRSLVELTSGSAQIRQNDGEVFISVKDGSARLSLVDANNNTQIWNLKKKNSARINNDTGIVFTNGMLITE